MLQLGVNIDHVATLRQARYAETPEAENVEPGLIAAASACESAGANGITIHLRSDRRHIQDRDVERLRQSLMTKLNLEMGNTADILAIALRILPEDVCLVPENRHEITTEGGLDVVRNFKLLEPTVKRLHSAGVRVSMFIDPSTGQVEASARLGADSVELHTGAFANATASSRDRELRYLAEAAVFAHEQGLQVNAGHGINYTNIHDILRLPNLTELNIGHSIIARAVMIGLENAVCEMLAIMATYNVT
ncbi:MAG: pyridoxine 5-phosphate synthase [Chthoniobacter sp.]|jgi:pyridoxine 5-phosphate synthase|nr:pyridoxine 5-phosphate synthase [Chthoniobacter sp.]